MESPRDLHGCCRLSSIATFGYLSHKKKMESPIQGPDPEQMLFGELIEKSSDSSAGITVPLRSRAQM
jgi:hypothetical protein